MAERITTTTAAHPDEPTGGRHRRNDASSELRDQLGAALNPGTPRELVDTIRTLDTLLGGQTEDKVAIDSARALLAHLRSEQQAPTTVEPMSLPPAVLGPVPEPSSTEPLTPPASGVFSTDTGLFIQEHWGSRAGDEILAGRPVQYGYPTASTPLGPVSQYPVHRPR